ncbi:GvpL/GvpF family gas vesicle protein [Sphaerisporangium sp. NPDC049002]|uniref:GvpL/GvpF family gas vesicle protein n=1 Tax=unclassified Sphaerisporangium TaxID=2630420 RepID=UPI003407C221
MADTGTYLYAVTREEDRVDPAALSGLTGVAGTPVHTVAHAGLVAYVGTVPLEEFGEGPLRRSLEDLDWVGETARAHHRVVEAVAGSAPTAPVRLVTVYSGEDQVRDMLGRRRDDFTAVLSQVAGRREWGVKAYAERAAEPRPSEPGQEAEAPVKPGTDYLRRRKESLRSRDDAWRDAARRAEDIHAALAAVSVASRRHRPQDPQLSGRDDWMLLNGAYLVDDHLSEEFAATLAGLRGPGVEIELTGPWAPYSFTQLDPGDPEAEARGSEDGPEGGPEAGGPGTEARAGDGT